MKLVTAGVSDVGRIRKLNEDAFLCDEKLGLFAVADGVGGHAKGEVASVEALSQIENWVLGARDAKQAYVQAPQSESAHFAVRRTLESAVQQACYMVFGMAEMNPEHRGMSTTISALWIIGTRAFIAQVGDSRVYLVRGDEELQLTEDHTLINYKLKQGMITAEEAKAARGKNVITRAVGHKDYVEVDNTQIDLEVGDRLILCSDGLHGYLQPNEIAPIVNIQPPVSACYALIDLANRRGGRDNITAVIVTVT